MLPFIILVIAVALCVPVAGFLLWLDDAITTHSINTSSSEFDA
jgi:hypothetical protein